MECPNCNTLKSKSYWRPSQWRAVNPVVEWFNCCKSCDPDGFLPNLPLLGSQLSTIKCPNCKLDRGKNSWMKSQWKQINPIVPWYYNCCKDCDSAAFVPDKSAIKESWFVIVHSLNQVKDEPSQFLQMFISDWMARLPKYVRKELSYQGFLDIYGGTFDPGNWIYYLAMKFILPDLLDYEKWNNSTVGDIWESLLGSTEDGSFAKWMRRYLKECVAFFELVTPEAFYSLWYSHGRRITFDTFEEWLWTQKLLDRPDVSARVWQ
jgi:hypothetical protein